MSAYFNSVDVRGHTTQWYYLLRGGNTDRGVRRGLLDDVSNIEDKMIVCAQPQPSTRYFAAFATHIDFYELNATIPRDMRHFYEVVFGQCPQKPHFDVDITCDEHGMCTLGTVTIACDTVLSELCAGIVRACAAVEIKLDPTVDIRVYTSHGLTKRSYHVICPHYCHTDNVQARAFYEAVHAQLPEHIISSKCIDSSVYSVKQQFRILGSSKPTTDRIKICVNSYTINDTMYTVPTGNALQELEWSLVSYTAGCTYLPAFATTAVAPRISGGPDITLTAQIIDACMQLCGRALNMPDIAHVFKVGRTVGGLISLQKRRPYHCPICVRTHNSENPYLRVNIYSQVYYYCRRSESANVLLGCIDGDVAGPVLDLVHTGPVCDTTTQFVGLTPLSDVMVTPLDGVSSAPTPSSTSTGTDTKIDGAAPNVAWCTDVLAELDVVRQCTTVPAQPRVIMVATELEKLMESVGDGVMNSVKTDPADELWN